MITELDRADCTPERINANRVTMDAAIRDGRIEDVVACLQRYNQMVQKAAVIRRHELAAEQVSTTTIVAMPPPVEGQEVWRVTQATT